MELKKNYVYSFHREKKNYDYSFHRAWFELWFSVPLRFVPFEFRQIIYHLQNEKAPKEGLDKSSSTRH